MEEIKDNGFTVIPMQDFIAWRHGDKGIPAKSCIITIDDGYLSGYETAWPILKKFGYPFTMFIYIDYIDSGGKSISWDQLAEMRDAGVDIESHTYSHSHLTSPGYGVDATTKARVIKTSRPSAARDGFTRRSSIRRKSSSSNSASRSMLSLIPTGPGPTIRISGRSSRRRITTWPSTFMGGATATAFRLMIKSGVTPSGVNRR